MAQDSVQRAFFFIARSSEVFQLVVVVTRHFGGLVAVEYIYDMFRFVFLVHLLDGLQRYLKQLARIHLFVGLPAVVAVAAVVLVVLFAEIVQQQLAAADSTLSITLCLE